MTLLSKKKKDTLQEQTVEPATTQYEDSKGENFYTDHWDNPPTEEDYATQASWIRRKYANDPTRRSEEINRLNNYKKTSWTGATQDAQANQTNLGSNISGTVNTSGAEEVQRSGTRSAQNSTSNTTSYNTGTPAPQPAVNAQPASLIETERQKAEEALQDAQANQTNLGTNISGTVNTSGADVVKRSGTRSAQNSTSNTTSYNTGTSVSQNQGRSESYAQEGMTPEQRAQYVAEYARMHPGYTIDDNGNVVRDPKASLYDVLQVDREKLRGERERQEEILRKKQLAHGLANSAMLISDMISAGIGGNVYKRDKDKTNEEADKEIARLREQQIADDMAAKEKEKLDRDKWSANLWKDLNDYRRSLYRNVNESTSTGSNQSVQQGQQFNRSQQAGRSNTVQTVSYDDALKGGGLRGYSRRSYGFGGGGKQDLTYWPMKIVNGAHGEEYMSFALDKEEKESLSKAIASSINTAADSGNEAAKALRDKYFKKLKRNDKAATWDYDALVNDGALYQVPGVLNRYLDELTQMGITHPVNGQNVPYTRRELYAMMTGDTQFANVPKGVILNQGFRPIIKW